MTTKRLTTDQLISELLHEIRNDRVAASKRDERVEAELSGIRLALHELLKDFRKHRDHAIAEASDVREQINMIADHAGVTMPKAKNGGG